MHSSSRQWKSVFSQDKRTLSPSFFIFSAIKLKPKACDRSLTSFYCDHTDLTSTDQIQQENKSWPGNFFAGTMHWDCIWPGQGDNTKNAFTGIPDAMGRLLQQVCTCCVDLPVPWVDGVHCTLHRWGPSFFHTEVIPGECFMQDSAQISFAFPQRPGLRKELEHQHRRLVFQKHGKKSAAL